MQVNEVIWLSCLIHILYTLSYHFFLLSSLILWDQKYFRHLLRVLRLTIKLLWMLVNLYQIFAVTCTGICVCLLEKIVVSKTKQKNCWCFNRGTAKDWDRWLYVLSVLSGYFYSWPYYLCTVLQKLVKIYGIFNEFGFFSVRFMLYHHWTHNYIRKLLIVGTKNSHTI